MFIAVRTGLQPIMPHNAKKFQVAENASLYCEQGDIIGVKGRLQKDSYEKENLSKGYTVIKREHQLNEEIRDREVRLIGETGEQLGIVSSREAQSIAEEKGLDLVKISPSANPPVCKLMNYGKYLFEAAKKAKEAKKNQKTVEIKEVWLSMTIDVGDLNVKARQAQKFLSGGNKVKVSIRMRGRQMAHQELGIDVMKRFYDIVKDCGTIEKQPLTEGRNIWMMLAPLKA